MGQLAISVVGAGVGSFFGSPQAGWLIGSVIGGLLFPQSGPDTVVEGPRLGDLTVTSSAYGAAIPVVKGTARLASNMIWSEGIEEVKSEDKQSAGGKGGGGATQTTVSYEYFCTFALSFAEGVADDLLRMWADGKLIYDKTGSGDDITKIDLNFRFYTGSETQEPDSLILANLGDDKTSAHRGLAYVVFDRLPLKDFGNRIPNITAELTFNGTPVTTSVKSTLLEYSTGFQSDSMFPDWSRSYIYVAQASSTPEENILRRINMRTMVEDRQSVIDRDERGDPNVGLDPIGS
jgi:hypothetical protein